MVVTEHDPGPIAKALKLVAQELPCPKKYCDIELNSEIPFRAGLGSSAAFAVALIKTLLAWHEIQWNAEQINQLAYQVEAIFHGTPSGIDNTVATYGGLCLVADPHKYPMPSYVACTLALPKFIAGFLLPLAEPIGIVVIQTNKDRETKKLVDHVRSLYNTNPALYEPILAEMGTFASKGYEFLVNQNYRAFGDMLNQNHTLLQRLEVSCPELDQAHKDALAAGAWGAKLTGAGGGGCLIAFCPGHESELIQELSRKGWSCFMASIGKKLTNTP